VSRGTWERARGSQSAFVYRTFTVCGQPSQAVRLANWFLTPRSRCPGSEHAPRHRRRNAGRLERAARFRLFPVRSPLLRESRLLSLPPGTEMFQFPGFASACADQRAHALRGCPIRRSRDHGLYAAPPGLSQLTTSFIAFSCLGIHRAPFRA